MDDGILKVNIGPLQGQEFSFAQSRVNCQIKKDSQLLRHDSGQGVVANRVRNACVVYSDMAFGVDGVGLFYEVKERSYLLGREELQLLSCFFSPDSYPVARVSVDYFPIHCGF